MSDAIFGRKIISMQSQKSDGDYEKNLAFAEQFIEEVKDTLPENMNFRWESTSHSPPKKLLVIQYRRRNPPRVPSFAAPISLLDSHSEFKKNVLNGFDCYKKLAEKHNNPLSDKSDKDYNENSTKENLCQKKIVSFSDMCERQSQNLLKSMMQR